jgi:hypothetical protein
MSITSSRNVMSSNIINAMHAKIIFEWHDDNKIELWNSRKVFFYLASTDVNVWMKSTNYYQHKFYVRVYQQFSNLINPNIIFSISNPPTVAS